MSLKHRMARAATTTLLAAAAWLPAQAGVVVGTFDPPFGPDIPNLGFRGTLVVRVPDACFLLPIGVIANSNPCSGGQMQVLEASVEFYNLNTPGLPTLTTLDFLGSTLQVNAALTYFDPLTGLNQLRNLDTGASEFVPISIHDPGPSSAPGDDINFDGQLSLQLFAQSVVTEGPAYGTYLNACFTSGPPSPGNPCVFRTTSRTATTVFQPRQFDQVLPEPGSLALAFSALAAAAWSRRRGPAPRPA